MSWTVHVIRMKESRGADRVLGGRREGKKQLGRPSFYEFQCFTVHFSIQ